MINFACCYYFSKILCLPIHAIFDGWHFCKNIRTIKNRTQYEYWWSCRSIMFSESVPLFAWVAQAEFLIDPFKLYEKREKIKFSFSTQNLFFVYNRLPDLRKIVLKFERYYHLRGNIFQILLTSAIYLGWNKKILYNLFILVTQFIIPIQFSDIYFIWYVCRCKIW